jgi:hypothetical protein
MKERVMFFLQKKEVDEEIRKRERGGCATSYKFNITTEFPDIN